jgi:5-methylcytosine-specific restriction endonuclease McrBC regulatory subunit McrC
VSFRAPGTILGIFRVSFTKLNERYRPAVELSKLVLRSISYELSHGQVGGTAFLVDMNDVFQEFCDDRIEGSSATQRQGLPLVIV